MGDRAIRDGRLGAALAALAAFALLLPAPAQAWGFFAHRKTADIAEANVSPETRAKIRRLMRSEKLLGTSECSLATIQDASVWPDCVRRTRWRWGYTAAWHYRTTPICEAYSPRANCSGGNCVTAQIERNHRILADESLPAQIRLEALAFMVHFAGDIHMPLHSGDRDDRGGNDRETDYGIVPSLNLHWIWDGPLAERAITSGERPIVRRYTSAERDDLGGGTAPDWGRESWEISRSFVYPTAFDTDDVCEADLPLKTALSQEDIVRGVPIARRRVQQAGLRIAELLESAFAPGPLAVSERR
ncbi:MAG: S1/P1 nuclease [Pseudomonadota bacterium]